MTKKQILNALEDALDVEQNSFFLETELTDINGYDSMAKLALIVLADDDFGKKLTGEQIRAFKTIGDIVDFLSA